MSDCCLTASELLSSHIMTSTCIFFYLIIITNCLSVKVSVITLSVEDRGFNFRSVKPKKIVMNYWLLLLTHTILRAKRVSANG